VSSFEQRRADLARDLAALPGPVRLRKEGSNRFRERAQSGKDRLDLRAFTHVLKVDRERGWVDAEAAIAYDDLVNATLACGATPAVVPELKRITPGGAAAGVAVEATSFRHGLMHETVLELEILLADGSIVIATPDNEHGELFHGFANSYGTLGYALRVKLRTLPVKRFVMVEREAHPDPGRFFLDLESHCHGDADFIDAVVFAPDEIYLNLGWFTDRAPETSDYGPESIYYRSIRDKPVDYLSAHDYLWRWDTDLLWGSNKFLAQHPLVRRLNARTYTRLMRLNARLGFTRALDRLRGLHSQFVIQDVVIPVARAAEFLAFLHQHVGILPLWICPLRPRAGYRFPLFPLTPGQLYLNFGFRDVLRNRETRSPGHVIRLLERKLRELGGIKSLHSESYFTEDEFREIYNGAAWERLKARYDPGRRLGDLYQKCVLRA
jgi:FAD/FMN-containing dehydrogenase